MIDKAFPLLGEMDFSGCQPTKTLKSGADCLSNVCIEGSIEFWYFGWIEELAED